MDLIQISQTKALEIILGILVCLVLYLIFVILNRLPKHDTKQGIGNVIPGYVPPAPPPKLTETEIIQSQFRDILNRLYGLRLRLPWDGAKYNGVDSNLDDAYMQVNKGLKEYLKLSGTKAPYDTEPGIPTLDRNTDKKT